MLYEVITIGCQKGHNPCAPGIQMFNDSFDGSAFARGIPSFKQHHHTQPFLLDMFLQLQQFDLQLVQLLLVFEGEFFYPNRQSYNFV